MSDKANKTLIGAFVLGALALMLIAVAVIGSGRLFSTQARFVMFFDSSIKGLSLGSPVVFRGVPVGRVSAISMTGNLDSMEFRIPVFVELDTNITKALGTAPPSLSVDSPEYLDKLVAHGLRARLNNQSLLTGQLLVELDFYPKKLADTGSIDLKVYEDTPVIPTIPSQFDTVWQRISQLPIDVLAKHLVDISEKFSLLLDAPALKEIPHELGTTMREARGTMAKLSETLNSFDTLATKMTSTLDLVGPDAVNIAQQGHKLITAYISLATDLKRSMDGVQGVVGPNAVTILELNRLMREATETVRAVRALANTLERNPESILLGKGTEK